LLNARSESPPVLLACELLGVEPIREQLDAAGPFEVPNSGHGRGYHNGPGGRLRECTQEPSAAVEVVLTVGPTPQAGTVAKESERRRCVGKQIKERTQFLLERDLGVADAQSSIILQPAAAKLVGETRERSLGRIGGTQWGTQEHGGVAEFGAEREQERRLARARGGVDHNPRRSIASVFQTFQGRLECSPEGKGRDVWRDQGRDQSRDGTDQ
jgi:hypothetical protein